MTNPIAFNPDTMTVSQLKECAETLRTLYTMVERDREDYSIAGQVRMGRDDMLRKWGAK